MPSDNQPGFLSDNTRKVRMGLLTASLIGFSISKVGFVITKISVLGSELTLTRIEAIPYILGVVVLYYLLTFISYGFDEYSNAFRKLRSDTLERIETGKSYSPHHLEENLKRNEMELKELEDELAKSEYMELKELEDGLTKSEYIEEKRKIQDGIREKKRELLKLERLIAFHRYYRGSFFERLKTRYFRATMELFAPIFIGTYTLILLFFFTPTPLLTETTDNVEPEIIIEETETRTKTEAKDKVNEKSGESTN